MPIEHSKAEPVVGERDRACADEIRAYVSESAKQRYGVTVGWEPVGGIESIIARHNAAEREGHVDEREELLTRLTNERAEHRKTASQLDAEREECVEQIAILEKQLAQVTTECDQFAEEEKCITDLQAQLSEAKNREDGLLLVIRAALAFTVPMNKMFSDAVAHCEKQPATPSEGDAR